LINFVINNFFCFSLLLKSYYFQRFSVFTAYDMFYNMIKPVDEEFAKSLHSPNIHLDIDIKNIMR